MAVVFVAINEVQETGRDAHRPKEGKYPDERPELRVLGVVAIYTVISLQPAPRALKIATSKVLE